MFPDDHWFKQRMSNIQGWSQEWVHALDRAPSLAATPFGMRLQRDLPRATQCLLRLDAARTQRDPWRAMAAMRHLDELYKGLARASVHLRLALRA